MHNSAELCRPCSEAPGLQRSEASGLQRSEASGLLIDLGSKIQVE